MVKRRLGLFIFWIGFLLGMWMFPTGLARAEEVSQDNLAAGVISLLDIEPAGFNEWYQRDKAILNKQYEQYCSESENTLVLLEEEWHLINQELQRLLAVPSYQDSLRGYKIYDANSSGQIHVLGLAKMARENWIRAVLEGKLEEKTASDLYPALLKLEYFEIENIGFEDLEYAKPDQYVTVRETRQVLDQISLPDLVFNDYQVFLLPYMIKDANGFSYSAALPLREECTFISAQGEGERNNPEATLTHEFGHYLHQQFIGDYSTNPKVWNEYLRIREKTSFIEQGEWAELTDENFAEDFKMLFGSSLAREERHRGSYGDPTRSGQNLKLMEFFSWVANQVQPVPLAVDEIRIMEENAFLNRSLNSIIPVPGISFLKVLIIKQSKLVIQGRLSAQARKGSQLGVWVEGKGMAENGLISADLVPVGLFYEFRQVIQLPDRGWYRLMVGDFNPGQKQFAIYYPMEILFLGNY